MTHGWRVDSADAYPVVECRDPDRALRPVVERDVEIVTACALSLGAFVLKHAPIFSSDTFTPVCESYFDDDDLEVRFTSTTCAKPSRLRPPGQSTTSRWTAGRPSRPISTATAAAARRRSALG